MAFKLFLQFLLVAFFSQTAFASTKSNLDKLVSLHNHLVVSVYVEDLNKSKKLYEHNSKLMLAPASTVKIITALAGLDYLGRDFTYKTSLYKNGNDFYLKFNGDPTLSKKDLHDLLKNFPETINKINVDDVSFDQAFKAEGWTNDDNKFCFAAPSSAIVVNKNCFQVELEDNKIINNNAQFIKIQNDLLAKETQGCAPELFARWDNFYHLDGCIDKNSTNLKLNIAFQNPRIMIQGIIKEFLNRDVGINFTKTPKNSTLLAEHESIALEEIVKIMLADSNNLMADNLLKTLVFKYFDIPGDFKYSKKVLNNILLNNYDYDFLNLNLLDGSGGSRYNLTDSETLSHIMKIFYIKYGVLLTPVSLFQEVIGLEDVLGKTGSLKGVQNLIGVTPSGKVFAIVINGVTNKKEARSLIVEIVKQINNL